MRCCTALYAPTSDGDAIFEVEAPRIKYGRGALHETGAEVQALGARRVALFADPGIARYGYAANVAASLREAHVDVVAFDGIAIEPTEHSFAEAIAFAESGNFDAYVSIGGGSTIDTAKVANLYATYPAAFLEYVNAPVGGGKPVPGPLRPHIALPTTAGTGSECTGMAIFDYTAIEAKTGIASKRLRPTLGIVDPDVTRTLPAMVVACAGFDVLSHALESYTARPFAKRAKPPSPTGRPLSQGANPFSDIACAEALRIIGTHLVRAVRDATDDEARERMMFASTLAGIGFGNAGVHIPHAMAYAVAGLVEHYHAPDYPGDGAIVPHGMSVILNAPSVFRFTAPGNPERHLNAVALLGGDANVDERDAGDALASVLMRLMRDTGMPNGLGAVGYGDASIGRLVEGTLPQQRLLSNAPLPVERDGITELFAGAMRYWS